MTRGETLEIMRMVHEHYRMDIEQIWKRGTIYLTISTALFALISSKDLGSGAAKIVFIGVGFCISLFWFLNAMLSHAWIEEWRDRLVELDKVANPYGSFSRGEYRWRKDTDCWRSKTYSYFRRPQVYAVGLAGLSVVLWIIVGSIYFVTGDFPGGQQVQPTDKATAQIQDRPPPTTNAIGEAHPPIRR